MKKGHHDRFQDMARDGYFLDGRGPSFGGAPEPSSSSSVAPKVEDVARGDRPRGRGRPRTRFPPGASGESRGAEGGNPSASNDAPKPKRKGPGRPPTLFNHARQLEMQLLQQSRHQFASQNGDGAAASGGGGRPVQGTEREEAQQPPVSRPQVQQQQAVNEEDREESERESEDASQGKGQS
jgi:hypothetical protein